MDTTRRAVVFGMVALLALGAEVCRRNAAAPSQGLAAGGVAWTRLSGAWESPAPDTLVGSGGHVRTSEAFGDATIEFDLELVRGAGGRTVGIGFRSQDRDLHTRGSGYGFNVTTGANTYNVFEGHDGDWRPVDPAFPAFHPSPAINPRGANHVAVRCAGTRFTVTVNGATVASFDDDSYPRGAFHFWVESTAEQVRFANIRVTRP